MELGGEMTNVGATPQPPVPNVKKKKMYVTWEVIKLVERFGNLWLARTRDLMSPLRKKPRWIPVESNP